MSDPHADAAHPESLEDVARKIHEAHEAEDTLLHTMPNAIHPNDDAYGGMSGGSEGDVEVRDPQRSDDRHQAESEGRTPTEQVEDDVVDGSAPPQGDAADDRT